MANGLVVTSPPATSASEGESFTGAVTTPLTFTPDATHDIGASGASRPQDIFASGNVTAGGNVVATGNVSGVNLTGTGDLAARDLLPTRAAKLPDGTGALPSLAFGSGVWSSGLSWEGAGSVITVSITASNRLQISGAGITVYGIVTPATDNARDLGQTTTRWKDQHIAGNIKWGTSASDPMIKRSGTGLQIRTGADGADAPLSASTLTGSGAVTAGSASGIQWSGRSVMTSTGDGTIRLSNSGGTGFTRLEFGASGPSIVVGTNTPEGAVTAAVGSIYFRTNGGANTSLYVKETGAGNTGWVPK